MIQLLLYICLVALCASSKVLPNQDDVVPAIVMVCGKNTQHRDVATGEWVTDSSGHKDCMKTAAEVLSYCQEVYPDLHITDVIEETKSTKVTKWCSIGHSGPTCKGHAHSVKPFRCVVDSSQQAVLDVPEKCSFQYLKNDSLCKEPIYWASAARSKCQDMSLVLGNDYAPIRKCSKPDSWRGIEFACCPSADIKLSKKVSKSAPVIKAPADPICLLPKSVGVCRASFKVYYYNTQSGKCERFVYGGCGGNDNRFNTKKECEEKCIPAVNDDIDADPVLSLPVGPVLLDTPSSSETADPPQEPDVEESLIRESAPDAAYFETGLDPDNEQELYSKALMDELKEHQSKIAKATLEWDSAKKQLLSSAASQTRLDQVDADYQRTVNALSAEHDGKVTQLHDFHQARLDALLVSTRQSNLRDFLDELSAEAPVASHVLRKFRHYLKGEHRDQQRTVKRFKDALQQGDDFAVESQPKLQARLIAIQNRVDGAVSMVQQQTEIANEIQDDIDSMIDDLVPSITLDLDMNNDELPAPADVEETLIGGEISLENGPVIIDEEGLYADDDETDTLDDDDDDDYYGDDDDDDDDDEISDEDPAFDIDNEVDEEVSLDDDDQDDYNEDESMTLDDDDDDDDELDIEPQGLLAVNYFPDDTSTAGYSEIAWLRWFGLFVGCALVLLFVLGVLRYHQVRRMRSRRFTRIQVDDHLTAEERQLLQMQQNGYENPTYKFFEKQQVA